MQKVSHTAGQKHITEEDILVVKRADLFANYIDFQGLSIEPLADIFSIINEKKEFLPRAKMETDYTYKQIIPYLIFNHENQYFLMQRKSQASEQRLKNKYTLGIGGHIRAADMIHNSILDWSLREFHEEVTFTGSITCEPLGILNDDSNDVGKVHIGIVLLLKGNHPDINIKSELKSGSMLSLDEMTPYVEHMESWSQTVYNFLYKQQKNMCA